MRAPRKIHDAIRAAALVIGSIALALAAMESAVRIIRPGVIEQFDTAPAGFVMYDARLGWKNRPGARMTHRPNPAMPEAEVAINSLGLRGAETTPARPRGIRRRIMVLGDSVAFGYGLPYEESFPAVLDRQLPGDTEVLNGAVIGYGTGQQYMLLAEELGRIEFDTLVVLFAGNDVADDSASVRFGVSKPYHTLTTAGGLRLHNVPVPRAISARDAFFSERPVIRTLFDASYLFRFVYLRFVDASDMYDVHKAEMTMPESIDVTTVLINDMVAFCASKGVDVLFVVMPHADWVKNDLQTPYRGTLMMFERARAHYIDLWPVFSEVFSEGLYQPGDITHPNARGQAIIAREVARVLAEGD